MTDHAVILVCVVDSASSSIQYSLKLVCDGLGRPSKDGVAVIHKTKNMEAYDHRCS